MKLNTEKIVSLSAILIALCSLLLSLYEGHQSRKYQRLTVKPLIDLEFAYKDDGVGWLCTNHGMGPAIVKNFQVILDGKIISHWMKVIRAFELKDPVSFSFAVPYESTIIKSGESRKLLGVKSKDHFDSVKQNFQRLHIKICYCSLHEECWLGDPKRAFVKRLPIQFLEPIQLANRFLPRQPNKKRGADGVKIAGLRKGRAKLLLI